MKVCDGDENSFALTSHFQLQIMLCGDHFTQRRFGVIQNSPHILRMLQPLWNVSDIFGALWENCISENSWGEVPTEVLQNFIPHV